MTAPVHIIGGITLTGIFGSMTGLNLLASPLFIATTIFGSLFPDIDHPKSSIGVFIKPISRRIFTRFGHRTLTHSFIFLIGTWIVLGVIETLWIGERIYTSFFCYGMITHLILDMITVNGIGFFYPFFKNKAVLPAGKKYRFTTGKFQSEVIVGCFFVLSFVFLQDLMKTGFWTQYNRLFGTAKHLASEFVRSDDVLMVNWKTRFGTNERVGRGYCVSASENRIILIDELSDELVFLDRANEVFLEFIPEHTGKELKYHKESFVAIGIDSLNGIFGGRYYRSLQIQSNLKFESLGFSGTNLKDDFGYSIQFENEPEKEAEKFVHVTSPRIKYLRSKIKDERSYQKRLKREFEEWENELEVMIRVEEKEEDMVKLQLIREDRSAFEKKPAKKPNDVKLNDLRAQLNEAISDDRKSEAEKRADFENEQEMRIIQSYTGFAEFFEII